MVFSKMIRDQTPPKIAIKIAPNGVDVISPLVIKLNKIFAGDDTKVGNVSTGRKSIGKSERGGIENFLTIVDLLDDCRPIFFRKQKNDLLEPILLAFRKFKKWNSGQVFILIPRDPGNGFGPIT